jgi:hypothetical protein
MRNEISETQYWLRVLGIYNYSTIRDNCIVDVNGDVNFDKISFEIEKIPVKFGIVQGYFHLCHQKIKTLQNSPTKVGDFHCFNNLLESLEGGPIAINGNFNCSNNRLLSLKGLPINGEINMLNCAFNYITSLEDIVIKINVLYCEYNHIFLEYEKYDNHQHYMRHLKLKELCKKNQ